MNLKKRVYNKLKVIKDRNIVNSNKNVDPGYYLDNKGIGEFSYEVNGHDNSIIIGDNTYGDNPIIRINGNNNSIVFGPNCSIGSGCSFWMEGNNISIEIHENTTFTLRVHLNAQEDNSKIVVGDDCMLSNHIIIRTSDSHPIYDSCNVRINPAQDIIIGSHVWIAPDSKIMKGSRVGNGCIIGSNTMVTASCSIPDNSLAVGIPAKVVKTDVHWTREALF